ncbi:MAG TPA: hypothetical protein VMC43_00370 [Candidatus Paceibacterota bacterium]|nr:hypothetical protein [Candidatus Paceibacterota bacterium]
MAPFMDPGALEVMRRVSAVVRQAADQRVEVAMMPPELVVLVSAKRPTTEEEAKRYDAAIEACRAERGIFIPELSSEDGLHMVYLFKA